MSFADKVQKYSEEAPVAGFVNVNYGKLTTAVNVLSWKEVDGIRAPVRVPFQEQEVGKGENLELTFTIGIDELNPKLDFKYERNVLIRKSSEDGKFKSDWSEVVLPSLEKVFGKEWAKVITAKGGVYVAAEHCDSVIAPKEGKKNYGVPKFIAKFKGLTDCKAARNERYGNKEDASEAIGIPAAVVEQANSLLKSLGNNMEQFKKMLEGKPFGNYDPDAIIAEMG